MRWRGKKCYLLNNWFSFVYEVGHNSRLLLITRSDRKENEKGGSADLPFVQLCKVVLELIRNCSGDASCLLGIHGAITDPVMFVCQIIHFGPDPEFRRIVRDCCIQYCVSRQHEYSLSPAVDDLYIAGVVATGTYAQAFQVTVGNTVIYPQVSRSG